MSWNVVIESVAVIIPDTDQYMTRWRLRVGDDFVTHSGGYTYLDRQAATFSTAEEARNFARQSGHNVIRVRD